MDDNLTTVMFLSCDGRELDYHFLLWRFEDRLTVQQRHDLVRIDQGAIPGYRDKVDRSDDSADEAEIAKVARANSTTTCCTLF